MAIDPAELVNNAAMQPGRYSERVRSMIQAGAEIDEWPDAFGLFGHCLTNPIPVDGPVGEIVYLSSLRYLGRIPVLFHRLGEQDGIDIFESVTLDGQIWSLFYLDMFHPRRSRKHPAEYPFASAPLSFSGVDVYVPDFPHGLPEAVAKLSMNLLGRAPASGEIIEIGKDTGFVRPIAHEGVMKGLRAGEVQRDAMSRRTG